MEYPKFSILKELLEYAPTEVIVEIILNTDPEDINYICSLNKRVHQICNKMELRNRYRQKYPGFYSGSFKEVALVPPHMIIDDEAPHSIYTDNHDNWVMTDTGYLKYMSRPIEGYRLVVRCHNVYEDYWMKSIELFDTKNQPTLEGDAKVLEKINNILRKMHKTYLLEGYSIDPETKKARKATDEFLREMLKGGVKLMNIDPYTASEEESTSEFLE
ncbi:MAG TPA: hypothetical protein PKD85_00635 [Saprospiraceae bacterium]|nr:hypothetical protein [Saprospiraceae bacterium]